MSGTQAWLQRWGSWGEGGGREHRVLGRVQLHPHPSSGTGHTGPLPCDPRRPCKASKEKQMSILEKYDYQQQEIWVVFMIKPLCFSFV